MRRHERVPVDNLVRLHPNAWSSLEVRLVDCSQAGFRAQCEARVRRRDEVTLEVPGVGPAKAYVVWVNGEEFGAEFVQPIEIDRADLKRASPQEVLARLLVQRAAAQKAQKWEHEERLRKEIAQKLPLQRG